MEFVFVVKRYDLFDLEFPHGFLTAEEADLPERLERARTRGFFVERRHAETDSTLKQIIPYGLVTCGDQVFLFRRTKNGGEARLHGRLSVGVGGHINPVDECPGSGAGRHTESAAGSDLSLREEGATREGCDRRAMRQGGIPRPSNVGIAPDPGHPEIGDVVDAGAERELAEELVLDAPHTKAAVGIINDDASKVGSVHFGIVYRIAVETPDVRVRETDQLEGEFVSRAALRELLENERERFETWSSLILDRMDEVLG